VDRQGYDEVYNLFSIFRKETVRFCYLFDQNIPVLKNNKDHISALLRFMGNLNHENEKKDYKIIAIH